MKTFLRVTALSLSAVVVQAQDIADTAANADNFKTLAPALTTAGLIDTLKGQGRYLVFSPADAAFAKLPEADLDALLADKAERSAVLNQHVMPSKMLAKDILAGKGSTSPT